MRRTDLVGFAESVPIVPGKAWIGQLPDLPGLYAAVLGRPFSRLSGETGILRIGQAGRQVATTKGLVRRATLRARWRSYWQFPVLNDRDVRDVLRALLHNGENIEIAYMVSDGPVEELRQRERELLRRFFDDHLELPPLNRQKP